MKINDIYCQLVFVSNYYDWPLSGVCRYHGKLYSFEREYNEIAEDHTVMMEITPLVGFNKIKRLLQKKLFEICVGHHWTYNKDGTTRGDFYIRYPEFFYRFLYRLYFRNFKLKLNYVK